MMGGDSEMTAQDASKFPLLGQGAVRDAFRIWSDRSASDLEALEWNPCMDLLACLSAPPDSTLSIYRLLAEDQNPKLLSEKITGIGTSLAWSPDGRQIAVGDRLGGVTVYDGESGAVVHMLRPHQHPVAALSWAGSASTSDLDGPSGGLGLSQAQWARMLPPLLAIPTSVTNLQSEDASEPFQHSSGLSRGLVCSVDIAGGVAISAGGAFLLKVFQLCQIEAQREAPQALWPEELEPQQENIAKHTPKALQLSPDYRTLAVLLGGSSSSSSYQPPSTEIHVPRSQESTPERPVARSQVHFGRDAIACFDVRSLAVRREEILNAATLMERLTFVSDYAVRACETTSKLWRAGLDVYSKKMAALQETLESYAFEEESKSLGQELLVACFSGLASDAMQTFLTKQTSPQQLLRMERTISQLFEYLSVVLSTRLRVSVQYMFVLLAQLEALANYPKKYKILGLEVASLRRMRDIVEDFSSTIDELLSESIESRCCTKTLFQVLLRMVQRLPNQAPSAAEMAHIAACGSPTQEELERFFQHVQQGKNLDLSEVTSRLCGPAGGRPGSMSDFQSASRASLTELVSSFAKQVDALGEAVQASLSQRVRCVACLEVDNRSPWSVLSSVELRSAAAAAANESELGLPGARGLGHPVISMSWTSSDQLLVLWTGGASTEEGSGLHFSKLRFGRLDSKKQSYSSSSSSSSFGLVSGERASLWPQRLGSCPKGEGNQFHFLLASPYDESQVACILVEESKQSKDINALLALLGTDNLTFEPMPSSCFERRAKGLVLTPQPLQEACYLVELLEAGLNFRQSELPNGYVSASCLRPMAARGVCSVYAWRGRRLLTLDMEANEDEDECDEEAEMSP